MKDYGEPKCVSVMARVLIGNKETTGILNETAAQRFPLIDPRRLDTIRFRYRGRFGKKIHGKTGRISLLHRGLDIDQVRGHADSHEALHWQLGDSYRGGDDSRGHEKNYDAYILRAKTQSVVYEKIQ